jgi:hypothetical protein
MAYKELRPMQPANDGNGTQLPLAEEACVEALAGLTKMDTSVQKAIKTNVLPAQLGTSLRYVIFLSLLFFRSVAKSERLIFILNPMYIIGSSSLSHYIYSHHFPFAAL